MRQNMQNMIMKAAKAAFTGRMSPMLRQPAGSLLRRRQCRNLQPCRYMQRTDHYKKKTSTLQSMREFFMHPLTWDRNNGYLNVLLALAIFGFVFMNSCAPCPEDRVPKRSKTDEK